MRRWSVLQGDCKMIVKLNYYRTYFSPLKYQRYIIQYCTAFLILCIMCYVYVLQTSGSQRSFKDNSTWNFSSIIKSAFSNKNNIAITISRDRKIVLLWTSFFRETNWLPSTKDLHCPVQECDITSNRSLLANSSAVILHWRNVDPEDLPPECPLSNENSSRNCPLLVLYNREAPPHSPANLIRKLNHRIHLIASYRKDSDFYAPYGKIVKRVGTIKTPELEPNRTAVCWLVSHCQTQSNREVYVNNLKRYIDVDVYGTCGNKTCPYSDVMDCYKWLSERCKFYLSFENSVCKDYSTEKLYYAMMTDMVPIVMGGDDYERYLPPHSYIDVNDFTSPATLGMYLRALDQDVDRYLAYFKWKEQYVAEFVPFQWFCDACAWIHKANATDLKPHKNVIAWWFDEAHCGT